MWEHGGAVFWVKDVVCRQTVDRVVDGEVFLLDDEDDVTYRPSPKPNSRIRCLHPDRSLGSCAHEFPVPGYLKLLREAH